MKLFNKMFYALILFLLTIFQACKKDNNQFSTSDLSDPISFFPIPTNKWLTFDSSNYYSSGFVGDVMPYYENGTFHIFYLHDGDGASEVNGGGFHPIHSFESKDLIHYTYNGKMINYSNKNDQDMALGTGSVVKVGTLYYFYYTGHNGSDAWIAQHPAETVKYATSTDLKNWTKKTSFNLVPPTNYDQNNFRDPYVFYNSSTSEYWMLITARTDGHAVITAYSSKDPSTDTWTLKGPIYSQNTDWENLECPDLFQWGDYWYLVYSDQKSSTVKYLVSSSATGPFMSKDDNILDGSFFYGARTETNGTNRYLFGWNYRKDGNSDYGNKVWGGNLIVHQLLQNSDGTLHVISVDLVSNTLTKNVDLSVIDQLNSTISNNNYSLQSDGYVHFNRINGQKRITTTIDNMDSNSDAGFIFGWARASSSDYYKIRFKSGIASIVKVQGTDEYIDASIPYSIVDGKTSIEMIIDNTSLVVYINKSKALTGRCYWLSNAQWGIYAQSNNITFNQLTLFDY